MKAVLDRIKLSLAEKADYYQRIVQPTAKHLGQLLCVEKWAIDMFTEELIRAGCAATLSLLVNHLDQILREVANFSCWQVISPVDVCGSVAAIRELISVQNKVYVRPMILIVEKVSGEEEIPDGVVGIVTSDMPDILSHVSVRARNGKVCFAACFDQSIFRDVKSKEGKMVSISLGCNSLLFNEVASSNWSRYLNIFSGSRQSLSLGKKKFRGKFAISAEEFTTDMVGAKSRNIQYLKKRLPSWIRVPTSVAVPFRVFEAILLSDINKELAKDILSLSRLIDKGDLSKIHAIKEHVLQLRAPTQLVIELKTKMKSSNMAWPGDEGEERWDRAWQAMKKVWASKWNERAYVSCRKAKLNHNDLCMALLVQEIISADYAFVIHTRNPLSGDPTEIYAEIVKGLGETLVGAHHGRAMSFITKKSELDRSHVVGYPSKRIGLFLSKSIIFRSDSNGEDLEGYAGAGLYDSIPMDREERVLLDYSCDMLVTDKGFQRRIFSKIAEVGKIIEGLYGSAQDIEGVVKNGEIYVVQTRPQM
ncbi:hypothetical protein H6P81_020308 [Aristolochia fimbriata]|uniref:Pyruvate phosphate dikinase AMP/ATP-binding domain-containing protein n=1 Tax=Aristolochia fimbriata TaxID=158543 RepID=A0AAV7DV23_ARIFI|nr:hypothetical protein H6P81_020308 [Aristolochia fimbriata]